MILHIIRHADPDYEHDTITEYGWKEAHALAAWLEKVPIDKIYTSPMGRAIATASPTCEIKGMTSEILPWTAESMDYMESHHLTPEDRCSFRYSLQDGFYDFEDFMTNDRMKTIEQMKQHSDAFLADLGYVRDGFFYKAERPNDLNIAVFCHGGFGSEWIAHLMGIAPGLMFPVICPSTTSVTTFSFPNDGREYVRAHLRHLNNVTHLHCADMGVNPR